MTSEKESSSELARVAFRAPPFWESNPELWFLQLESQFKLSGITADETKFHSVISALEVKVLTYVSDLIRDPPEANKYESLKSRILTNFSQSDSSKMRMLLQELQLGDKRPSQLLQEMRNLSGKSLSDDVLKSLWLQKLPNSMQQILAVCEQSLDGLSKVADTVNEVSIFNPTVASVSQDSLTLTNLKHEIENLSSEIKRLSRSRIRENRRYKRPFSRSKERSQSKNTKSQNKTCWYHRKFANNAHKCIQPCSFVQEN